MEMPRLSIFRHRYQNTAKTYGILNGTIGLNLKQNSFYFWDSNVTDKNYILYVYDFGAVHLGNPLIFGTTLALKL